MNDRPIPLTIRILYTYRIEAIVAPRTKKNTGREAALALQRSGARTGLPVGLPSSTGLYRDCTLTRRYHGLSFQYVLRYLTHRRCLFLGCILWVGTSTCYPSSAFLNRRRMKANLYLPVLDCAGLSFAVTVCTQS